MAATVLLWLFGRGALAWYARQTAAGELRLGAVTAAREWAARAARLDPDDGQAELMRAACFRQLKEVDLFVEALESAERKGAPAARVEQERQLGQIQAGRMRPGADHQVGALIADGLAPHDVAAAFVYGCLARNEPEEATKVLDAWAADFPEDAHVAYMSGVYWQWQQDPARAETQFQLALARQPRHELARTALAGLLEGQDRIGEAFEQYLDAAKRFPASQTALAGLARLLRTLGQLDEARTVLAGSRAEISPELAVETAQVELESAHYRQAGRWFEHADLDRTADRGVLRAAATASALDQEVAVANRLFARADAGYGRARRISDLRVRLAIDPEDKAAADELQRLAEQTAGPSAGPGDPRPAPAESASELYALHCSACHGDAGRGDGRAARHLFPRPRDLRTDPFRLVSTRNGVARLEDVEGVIRRGIPGTAMRSLEDLPEDQRRLLAEEVLRISREGIREQLIAALQNEGEEIDEEETRRVVEVRTSPGEAVHVPRIGPPDPAAMARGKDAYLALGCDKCHGEDGAGVWDNPLFDEKGDPSPPRDLVHDPFKGGHEPEAIYLRIVVGMPGSAHPSCPGAPQDQLIDVVQYCRGLSREPKRALTNYERLQQGSAPVFRFSTGQP